MSDLSDCTATELIDLYREGRASPVEAVQDCLSRIEAVDPDINAAILPLPEHALAAAEESAGRWAAGSARPLEGVPYALKDIIATAGIRTSGGSKLYADWIPDYDAAVAARLRDAGGVLLAKLHTFEFACGGADNQLLGACRNPWDTARTTGGSSSGSGAAVAAREVPLAIGTDTGGSIRIPAAYCGITGIKPTYGRVPRHGVMGLSWTLDHVGPMARSAVDCALALHAIAGSDPRDSASSTREVPDYRHALTDPVTGMRIGRPAGWLEDLMHPAVAEAYEAALEELEQLGVTFVPVELPSVDIVEVAGWIVMYAEMHSLHSGHWNTLEERDRMGRDLLASTPFVTASDYLRALRYRRVFQQEIETALEGCTAIVVPGCTTIAPKLNDMCCDVGGRLVDWLQVATRTHLPFNYAGCPGLCVPIGLADGMPVSLQLVGRPHDESSLFAIGAEYQRATNHHLQRPPLIEERTAAVAT